MPSIRNRTAAAVLTLALATFGVVAMPTAASGLEIEVTSAADSGPGTLRAVIAAAADGDVITFADSVNQIVLADSLTINKSLHIQGPGIGELTITRVSPSASVMSLIDIVSDTADVVLSGLTLLNPTTLMLTGAIAAADVHDLTLDSVRVAQFFSQPGTVSISNITPRVRVLRQ